MRDGLAVHCSQDVGALDNGIESVTYSMILCWHYDILSWRLDCLPLLLVGEVRGREREGEREMERERERERE